jgi:8-oxo-dGTP pyrophosphatase MutT (NUDIX family)
MHYPIRGSNGLPGGHVEAKEEPDETIKREILEELTLKIDTIKRSDFFLSEGSNGRIILAYTAIAPVDVDIKPTRPKFEYGVWVPKAELADIVMSSEYTRFVLENWPKLQA